MRIRRTTHTLARFGALVLALGVFVALAQTPQESAGALPPVLVIPDQPALEDQAKTLEKILEAAPQAKPGGGILTGLKNLFSPKPQKIVLPARELWENAEPLKGSQIEVHGVMAAAEGKLAFRTRQGEIPIDLGGGVKPAGFPSEDLDWMPAQAVGLVEMPFGKPVLRISSLKPSLPLASLRLARVLEKQGKYREALKAYDEATRELQRARLPWAAFAATEAGWIAYHRLRDAKAANRHLYMAWTTYALTDKKGKPLFTTWVPSEDGKTWKEMPVADAVGPLLDSVGRNSFWYRLVDFFVTLGGGNAAIGVILLAFATRLGIHPLTLKQLASMEAMRKLQPQIKALQEEFKDDKQRFQQEMWKVWQENGVNPFGGCWPMLIQMPILIFVYQGIRKYIVRFSESGFLWVHNLAMPDMVLLIAYTLSMVFFQKMANRMQPMPADEKQRQQQQMMTWMMPLMFFFFFKTLPSAFILYWLASNLIYFGEQWWFRRQVEAREAAGDEPTGAPGPRKRSKFMEMMAAAVERASAQQTAPADPPEEEKKSSSAGGKSRSRSRKKKRKKG